MRRTAEQSCSRNSCLKIAFIEINIINTSRQKNSYCTDCRRTCTWQLLVAIPPPLARHNAKTAQTLHHWTATAPPLHHSTTMHRQHEGRVYKASLILAQAFVTIRGYDAVHSHPGEEDLLTGWDSLVVTNLLVLMKCDFFFEDKVDIAKH